MSEVTVQRGSKNKQKTVIHDMRFVSPDRSRKDMGMLKQAIQRAESVHVPNRSNLYDLYHDIITIDGHLSGITEKRTDAVKNKQLKFIGKDKQRVEALDDLIGSAKFKDLVALIMERKYWGVSGVEFIIGECFDYEVIPRKHIHLYNKTIVNSQYDYDGICYEDMPFVWVLGCKDDLGKLLQCSMYALYKRSGFGDFAQYVEIFGQPVRIIYYDAYDTKTKSELKQTLEASGSSLTMMIPKQAQFSMLDGKTSNGTGDLQMNLIKACNDEMSVAILGNSETTTSSKSSGYAQSKEHGKQQLEITKSDMEFVLGVLNEPQFINILKSYGFPVEGGKFEFEQDIDLDKLKIRLEIDAIVCTKVPVGDDYWYDTYGIPKPKNYDQLKIQMVQTTKDPDAAQETPMEDETDVNEPNEPKETKPNGGVQITRKQKSLASRIGSFFFGGHEIINLSDYYGRGCGCGYTHLPNLAAADFGGIYDDIARRLLSSKYEKGEIPKDLYFETATSLMDSVNKGLGGSSFDYDDSRNILKSYLTRNIYHFSAAKSTTEMVAFRDMMFNKDTNEMLSPSDFRAKVLETGKLFNETYLNTERNTAEQSAIMAHKWDTLDTEFLQFTTVGDNRVRPKHALLDGLTYPKSHPIWEKMYPPIDYNDRCSVVPGIGTKYDASRSHQDEKTIGEMVDNTIFDNNVGITRLIFDGKHPYYENLKTKETKALSFQNYGLVSLEKLQNGIGLKDPTLIDSEAFDRYWNEKKNHAQGIVLKDPIGQNVLFSDTFKSGLKHHEMIANIQEIIHEPDEVWSSMTGKKLVNHYVKTYKGKTLVVSAQENKAISMNDVTTKGIEVRKGLLLYLKP